MSENLKIKVNEIAKKLCGEAIGRILKKQPVSHRLHVDCSNVKKWQYVERIEDGVAIPHDKCGFIEKMLK